MPAERLKTCFVIMGFGKKTDLITGRTLDLDATYRYIIKPAVEDAGLECFRADEIIHSGLIDRPMYEQLFKADVVVADLSTANTNALYELGVRHALRPSATIVIAEDKFYAVPFDVTAVNVRRYKHLGQDIGLSEAMRFRKELAAAVSEAASGDDLASTDSPVYIFLPGLKPPTMSGEADAGGVKSVAPAGDAAPIDDAIFSRIQQADEAQRRGDFLTAKSILTYLRDSMKTADPYIIQRLALVTYKSRSPTDQAALEEARDLLKTLAPEYSNDTETLGLWGAVHKRLWELTGDVTYLDEAVRSYERGFYLRNDPYNGINYAFLLNVRSARAAGRAASAASPSEAVAARADSVTDFVLAERVRREVLSICKTILDDSNLENDLRYWILVTMAEAYLGVGDESAAQQKLEEAFASAPAEWMKESTREQMNKLRGLLDHSPLKSL